MSPAKKAPDVRTGQLRVAPDAPLPDRREILVGEPATPRNGAPMFVVYRRDSVGIWRKVKAYGAKRIARAYPEVKSEGHPVPEKRP
ncbi:hypothetical protein Mx9_p32 [Myxococcus phage Mx9]|nr:hypothetical protein Mx9_p32 [Myxococcus phage Mx9]